MAKSTRFATTVVTRNLLTPQGCDGFYLDGRASGSREARGGDTTLDREDRGFFYALYSNMGADYKQTAVRNKKYLDKIFEDMKVVNRYNIDYEINELADCAVNISGRLTLGDAQQMQPYFTGIVVKDGELAAITSGRGCAYLYRNDLLYPLTKDEYPLSTVDLQGNQVNNLDLYCAGLAGTIRYSNIAQLQPDDCFFLCNKEVMETVGHHNILRIMDEASDQQDAAYRIIDEMARQNPGATAQVMIGFVENITTLDKAGLKSLTGRMGWEQKAMNTPIRFDDANTPPVTAGNTAAGTAASMAAGAAAGAVAGGIAAGSGVSAQQPTSTYPSQDDYAQTNRIPGTGNFAEPNPIQPAAGVANGMPANNAFGENGNAAYSDAGYTQLNSGVSQQGYQDQTPNIYAQQNMQNMQNMQNYNQQNYPNQNQPYSDPYTDYNKDRLLRDLDEDEGMTTGKKVVIGVMLALILALALVLAYMLFADKLFGGKPAVTARPTITGVPEAIRPTREGDDELFPESTKRDAESTEQDLSEPSESEPRISEPTSDDNNSDSSSTNSSSNSGSTSSSSNKPRHSKADSSNKRSTGSGHKYTVKSGDTLWSIANANRGTADINDYMQKIIESNPDAATADKTNLNLYPDMEIVIPAP